MQVGAASTIINTRGQGLLLCIVAWRRGLTESAIGIHPHHRSGKIFVEIIQCRQWTANRRCTLQAAAFFLLHHVVETKAVTHIPGNYFFPALNCHAPSPTVPYRSLNSHLLRMTGRVKFER